MTDTLAPTDSALAPLEFAVTKNLAAKSPTERAHILENPGFGTHFTDHMVDVCWSATGGWHRPRVQPYGPLSLDPAAAVLHYGQEIFEGIKAYRHANGAIYTFRPEQNALRLQRSARRLALPELPTEYFLQSLHELIAVDGAWVPSGDDQSLYLRPFMFAKEAFLGVRPANKVSYNVIASPAGSYFTGGVKPVKIWLSERYQRAAKGGTGAAKTGGNYAASLLPQAEAYENGCDQVVFLDADGNIEELGGMNILFVRKDGTIVTPASDTILDGITRNSILELARERGLTVEQRPVSLTEWREGVASGEITEVFACGTAAVITPIGALKAVGFEDEQPVGTLALSLREELTDIQYGRREDTHGWLHRLDA
jgi:branched-chain amino acid aminotransferase